MDTAATQRPVWWTAAGLLLAALAFGAAYSQAPLNYSNQNQYLLHGFAQAGRGYLADDWLANTRDPTPVFSKLVEVTDRYLHENVLHLYYLALQGVYLLAVLGLFAVLAGPRDSWRVRLGFLALIFLVHAAVTRWASYRLFGLDYPWYLQAGVAGQYALGGVFQPSAFAPLLVVSLWLYARGRPFWAVALACLAATVHSTYLLPAGLLTMGFMTGTTLAGEVRRAALVGGTALVLVAPVAIFTAVNFRPTDAETFAEAQRLLAHVRIPHHTQPELWCDPIARGQIAWTAAGIALTWGTRLFVPLLTAFAGSAALTLAQVATGSDTLALLFPWRVSAVLVPVATTVILTRLVMLLARWLETPAATVGSAGLIGLTVGGGLVIMAGRLGFQAAPEEQGLLAFVRDNKAQGDCYLIPVSVPDLARTTRGSLSSDFKPAADKQKDPKLIPVDLQRFRLATGATIYVDFKSIPYLDTDVLEWHRRLRRAEEWQANPKEALPTGISHVVLKADASAAEPRMTEVYADQYYRVYALFRKDSR